MTRHSDHAGRIEFLSCPPSRHGAEEEPLGREMAGRAPEGRAARGGRRRGVLTGGTAVAHEDWGEAAALLHPGVARILFPCRGRLWRRFMGCASPPPPPPTDPIRTSGLLGLLGELAEGGGEAGGRCCLDGQSAAGCRAAIGDQGAVERRGGEGADGGGGAGGGGQHS